MFYVSMSKEALQKVVEHAKSRLNEQVVGVLIGRMEDQTVVVEDAVSGEIEACEDHVTMRSETIAKIADDIINQRVKGNIVGWYHSHPRGGIFMSDVDVLTQSRLQQFSPYIVALVVDSVTGDAKFYTLNYQTRSVMQISEDCVHIFNPGESPLPPRFKLKAAYQPRFKSFTEKFLPKKQFHMLILAIIAIGILISASIFATALVWQRPLVISHTPVTKGVASNAISVEATVTGGVYGLKNVTLYYKLTNATSWKTSLMLLTATGGNTYASTIPGTDVTGNIDYYIAATDGAGNVATSLPRTIAVADFSISSDLTELYINPGKYGMATIAVSSLNDFNSPVSLSIPGIFLPGVTFWFSPASVTPPRNGTAYSTLTFYAAPTAYTGAWNVTVSGKSGLITHECVIELNIPDFDFTLSPTSLKISSGESAVYNLTLTARYGFSDVVSFSVGGLPADATWEFIIPGSDVPLGKTMTLMLKIDTEYATSSGTYSLTITGTCGELTHQKTVTLIIV
jgi:COP9 signalosome complex subunit 5